MRSCDNMKCHKLQLNRHYFHLIEIDEDPKREKKPQPIPSCLYCKKCRYVKTVLLTIRCVVFFTISERIALQHFLNHEIFCRVEFHANSFHSVVHWKWSLFQPTGEIARKTTVHNVYMHHMHRMMWRKNISRWWNHGIYYDNSLAD